MPVIKLNELQIIAYVLIFTELSYINVTDKNIKQIDKSNLELNILFILNVPQN